MKQRYYKPALFIAAEAAYKDEVVATGMESLTICEDGYESKEQWIAERVSEWLEEAAQKMERS